MKSLVACLLLMVALGCKERPGEPAPAARFAAVKAPAASEARWCDNTFAGGAPRLTLPPLAALAAGQRQPSLPPGKRVWVNLWATWCQPCLREMPLLLKWRDDLRKDGLDVEVLLLSVDEDGEALQKFLAERKEFAGARIARAASQRDYEEWVKTYVKDPGAPIPLHLLAAADGLVHCVRGGSLREGDYPAAKAALR
jgi:thiol-disulfide isomerase/thioredoxin